MEFTNEITVAQPTDEVFAALTDVERVASCLPGARVEGRDGDVYRGAMRIKVGPITADYRGTLEFEELDTSGRRAVLLASGEETTGQGSAQARVVSCVVDDAAGARVVVTTELQVRGRVAQFGSGAMEKIAKRMFLDFAKNLEQLMVGERQAAAPAQSEDSPTDTVPSTVAPNRDQQAGDSFDVVGLIREPVTDWLRRAGIPVLTALALGFVLGRRRPAAS
jgi:carbon monoxide dehydrogenase subunit G